MRYTLVSPEGESVFTIIDNETGLSILSIDVRSVSGKEYNTPVFNEETIAKRVLDLLNSKR